MNHPGPAKPERRLKRRWCGSCITTDRRPEFVVLGGLLPELLCADSGFRHAGTTDIDVQVDLEIACGSVNTRRLGHALRDAEFQPDAERIWRWTAGGATARVVIKFELLADLDDQPAHTTFPVHRM